MKEPGDCSAGESFSSQFWILVCLLQTAAATSFGYWTGIKSGLDCQPCSVCFYLYLYKFWFCVLFDTLHRCQWCNKVLETWPKLTTSLSLSLCLSLSLSLSFPSPADFNKLMKLGFGTLVLKGSGIVDERRTGSWTSAVAALCRLWCKGASYACSLPLPCMASWVKFSSVCRRKGEGCNFIV